MDPRDARILIGEDDAVVARDMRCQLRTLGYQVDISSGTPLEVASLAKHLRPDVVVLDLNIRRDLQGVKAEKEIQQKAGIPIVFVSVFAVDVPGTNSASFHDCRYVTKPFVLAYLHAALQELLGKQGNPAM